MSLNTTPRTWVNGEVDTAAFLNAELRDAMIGIQAAYSTYTPTWTGITVGNGTQAARYMQVGKNVHAYGRLTFGSTTTVTAVAHPSLPVAQYQVGSFINFHTGSFWYVRALGGNNAYPGVYIPNQHLVHPFTRLAPGVPGTFGVNDFIQWSIRYEAS